MTGASDPGEGARQDPVAAADPESAGGATLAVEPVPAPRGAAWRTIVRWVSRHPLDFDEERTRLVYASMTAVAVVMLAVFGVYHLVAGPRTEGWVNLAVGTLLAASLVHLRHVRDGTLYYRGSIVLLGILFVFFGTLGGTERAMWSFAMPAFALFATGVGFGTTISLVVYCAWLLLFNLPVSWTGAADYTLGFELRFTGTYFTILLLSVFVEHVRGRYAESMRRNSRALERANEALRRSEDQLREMAMMDPLTGIANRRAILAHLDREILRSQRGSGFVTVAMLDIDRFKEINDTLGHPVGDRVLAEIAARVGKALRSYDTVGRYGGEEFLLVLPASTPDDVPEILERIRKAVAARPFEVDGTALRITASLGAATTDGDVVDAAALIDAADRALYRAKEAGRDRVRQVYMSGSRVSVTEGSRTPSPDDDGPEPRMQTRLGGGS